METQFEYGFLSERRFPLKRVLNQYISTNPYQWGYQTSESNALGSITWVDHAGTSYSFDGTYYLENTDPAGLPSGNDARSIFGWIKVSSNPLAASTKALFGYGNPEDYNNNIDFLYNYGGTQDIDLSGNSGTYNPGFNLIPDRWYFIGFKFNGSGGKFWLKSQEGDWEVWDLGDSFDTDSLLIRVGLGLTSDFNNFSNLFIGDVGGWGIWDHYLTDDQVEDYFNAGQTTYSDLPDSLKTITSSNVTDAQCRVENIADLQARSVIIGDLQAEHSDFAQAAYFTGSNDITVTSAPTTVNSISLWFNMHSGVSGPLVIKGVQSWDSFTWDWALWLGGDNIYYCAVPASAQGSYAYTPNTWNHLVLVRDNGSNSVVYLNNSLVMSGETGNSNTYDNIIAVGGVGGQNCVGSLQEVQLYSSILTPADITALYNSGSGVYGVGTESNLLAAYHLNGNANDYSINDNNGTWSGGASYTSGVIAPSDLLIHFPVVENSGSTLHDFSGDDFTGTLGDGVSFTNIVDNSLLAANAANFDGASGLIINSAPTNVNSVSLWFKVAGDTIGPLIVKGNDAWDSNYWDWGMWLGENTLYFVSTSGATMGTVSVTPDTWNHVVLVRDDGSGSSDLYFNGTSVASAATSGLTNANGDFIYVGEAVSEGPELIYGAVQEIQLYSTALGPSDVTALYNSGYGVYGTGSESGLIGGYHLNGDVDDYSSGNNNGVWRGNENYVKGKIAISALSFNGSGHVDVPHNDILNAYPITISAWFNTTDTSSTAIVNKYVSGSLDGYQIYLYGGSLYAWYFGDSSHYVWNGSTGISGGSVNDGAWHLATFVVDASGGKLYLDGTSVGTRTWTGSPMACITTTDLVLGYYPTNSNYTGLIADVRIYSYALLSGDVSTLYAGGNPTGVGSSLDNILTTEDIGGYELEVLTQVSLEDIGISPQGCNGYWKFDEGSGTSILDSSGQKNTGISTNITYIASGDGIGVPSALSGDTYSLGFYPLAAVCILHCNYTPNAGVWQSTDLNTPVAYNSTPSGINDDNDDFVYNGDQAFSSGDIALTCTVTGPANGTVTVAKNYTDLTYSTGDGIFFNGGVESSSCVDLGGGSLDLDTFCVVATVTITTTNGCPNSTNMPIIGSSTDGGWAVGLTPTGMFAIIGSEHISISGAPWVVPSDGNSHTVKYYYNGQTVRFSVDNGLIYYYDLGNFTCSNGGSDYFIGGNVYSGSGQTWFLGNINDVYLYLGDENVLISHWAMSEQTGTTVGDSQGSHNGEFTNNPLWGQAPVLVTTTSFVDGISVVQFNAPIIKTHDFSFSIWINNGSVDQSVGTIVLSNQNDSGCYGVALVANYGDNIWTTFYGDGDGTYHGNNGVVLPLNTWVHYVYVKHDFTTFVYLNGVCVSADLQWAQVDFAEANNFILGGFGWPIPHSRMFNGALDDLRVYSRSLSSAEVTTLYSGGTLTSDDFLTVAKDPIVDNIGVSSNYGTNAVYSLTWSGTPETGYVTIDYLGYSFSIDVGLDDLQFELNEHFGSDVWVLSSGSGYLHLTGPQEDFDSSPWSIDYQIWANASEYIYVTDHWTNGVVPILQFCETDTTSAGLISFWNMTESSGTRYDSVSSNHLAEVDVAASFTYSSVIGVNVSTSFTDTSILASSWYWTFGDGGHSTSQNPTHTYTSIGTYNVNLIINGGGHSNFAVTHMISVVNPTASFDIPEYWGVGEELTFTDTSLYASSWNWVFGDGGTSTSENPTHTYEDVGTYTVILTVNGGNVASADIIIESSILSEPMNGETLSGTLGSSATYAGADFSFVEAQVGSGPTGATFDVSLDVPDTFQHGPIIDRTQTGISDATAEPATNVLSLDSDIESGSFSLQHPDINSGDTLLISVNNVTPAMLSVTAGVSTVSEIQYITLSGNATGETEASMLQYNGGNFSDGTTHWDDDNATIQGCFDAQFGDGNTLITGDWQTGGISIAFQGSYVGNLNSQCTLNPCNMTGTDVVGATTINVVEYTTGVTPASEVQTITLSGNAISGDGVLYDRNGAFSGYTYATDSNATIQGFFDTQYGSGNTLISGSWATGGIQIDFQNSLGNQALFGIGQIAFSTFTMVEAATTINVVEIQAGVAAVDGVYTLYLGGALAGEFALCGNSAYPIGCDGLTVPTVATIQGWVDSFFGVETWLVSGTDATGPFTLTQLVASTNTIFLNLDDDATVGGTGVTVTQNTASVAGVYEVQTVTLADSPDGGDWGLAGSSNTILSCNAAYTDVQSVLDTQLGGGVTTATNGGTQIYEVTWNTYGPQSLLTVDGSNLTKSLTPTSATPINGVAGVYEVQTVTLADDPTGGTWILNSGSPLAYNASSSDLQTQLGITVSGSDGGPYTVTWSSYGPQSLLTADGSLLTTTDTIDLVSYTTSSANSNYTLTLGGIPSSGNLWLYFNGYNFIISYTGTGVNINGNSCGSIQVALDLISTGAFGLSGTWVVTGDPTLGGEIIFSALDVAYGSSPWRINNNGWNVSVSDAYVDASPPTLGNPAVHSLALPGAFGGTFNLNSFDDIPWNVDTSSLKGYWSSNVTTVNTLTGSGADGDPWIITYTANGPVSLPTIDGSALVGFTDDFLQSTIGGSDYFIVSGGVGGPWTLTSVSDGSGQTEITAENDDLIGGTISNDFTDGVTGVVGQDEIQTIDLRGATSGTWSITWSGHGSTGSMAYNISTSDLASELNTLFGLSTITVTQTVVSTYTADFGVHGPQDFENEGTSSNLTRPGLDLWPTGGSYILTIDSTPYTFNWNDTVSGISGWTAGGSLSDGSLTGTDNTLDTSPSVTLDASSLTGTIPGDPAMISWYFNNTYSNYINSGTYTITVNSTPYTFNYNQSPSGIPNWSFSGGNPSSFWYSGTITGTYAFTGSGISAPVLDANGLFDPNYPEYIDANWLGDGGSVTATFLDGTNDQADIPWVDDYPTSINVNVTNGTAGQNEIYQLTTSPVSSGFFNYSVPNAGGEINSGGIDTSIWQTVIEYGVGVGNVTVSTISNGFQFEFVDDYGSQHVDMSVTNGSLVFSNPYVQLAPDSEPTHGSLDYSVSDVLGDRTEFVVQFDLYAYSTEDPSAPADAIWFYLFKNVIPVNEVDDTDPGDGYQVYFDEYSSNLAHSVSLVANNTIIASAEVPNLGDGTWRTATIVYENQRFRVYLNEVLLFDYDDSGGSGVSLTSDHMGLGARSGGNSASHRVRNLSFYG